MKKDVREKLAKRVFVGMGVFLLTAVVYGIVAVIYLIEVKNINVDLRDVLVLAGVVIVLIVIAIRIL